MTSPRLLPAATTGDVDPWEQALYAFLIEKGNRSGSRRTVEGYGRMLWPFFRTLGKTPDQVTPADVLSWSHGIGLLGRTPSATTVDARISCLSSYYRFLIRMRIATSNPCDALKRPRTVPSVARGLSADEVRRLLSVLPDTVTGQRDRALLLTFILTGRRRAEVIGLTAGDISLEGEVVFYTYKGKGNKRGRRELPRPAYEALRATLGDDERSSQSAQAPRSDRPTSSPGTCAAIDSLVVHAWQPVRSPSRPDGQLSLAESGTNRHRGIDLNRPGSDGDSGPWKSSRGGHLP
jgi:site-specific recombinase XerC